MKKLKQFIIGFISLHLIYTWIWAHILMFGKALLYVVIFRKGITVVEYFSDFIIGFEFEKLKTDIEIISELIYEA